MGRNGWQPRDRPHAGQATPGAHVVRRDRHQLRRGQAGVLRNAGARRVRRVDGVDTSSWDEALIGHQTLMSWWAAGPTPPRMRQRARWSVDRRWTLESRTIEVAVDVFGRSAFSQKSALRVGYSSDDQARSISVPTNARPCCRMTIRTAYRSAVRASAASTTSRCSRKAPAGVRYVTVTIQRIPARIARTCYHSMSAVHR